jgi:hypothetical protein
VPGFGSVVVVVFVPVSESSIVLFVAGFVAGVVLFVAGFVAGIVILPSVLLCSAVANIGAANAGKLAKARQKHMVIEERIVRIEIGQKV